MEEEKKIPKQINDLMDDYGCNDCEIIRYKDRDYYNLSLVDDQGNPVPIGLPIIAYIDGNDAITLNEKEAFELIDNVYKDE